MANRLLGMLGAALLLACACGGGTPTQPNPINADVFFANGGSAAHDIPNIGLYDSGWEQGQGFKLFVHGIVRGGTPPYKVTLTYPTRGSSLHYDSKNSETPIFGVIFVQGGGDPRIRVQVTDSSSPELRFDKLVPEVYDTAPAAPKAVTAPSVRILGLQGPSLRGCGATLSVLVGATNYAAYWSGGIIAGGKVAGYRTQTLKANFNHNEHVTVVVRDTDPDQIGRPAAIVTKTVC